MPAITAASSGCASRIPTASAPPRKRSTPSSTGLKWLGLDWDDETVFQFARAPRHAEVAQRDAGRGQGLLLLLHAGGAGPDARGGAAPPGKPMRYDGRWRDRDPKDAPAGVKPVIRLKAPPSGETVVQDKVQGEVAVANEQLDDMVLLRSDGTPTYMHAVVVDDHDMGITHVIRGDDHLTNTFRQMQIYQAMGWDAAELRPHPADPRRRTARSCPSATARSASRPIATWATCRRRCATTCCGSAGAMATTRSSRPSRRSSGSTWTASAASPSRFDFAKLDNLNGHYMRQTDDARLAAGCRASAWASRAMRRSTQRLAAGMAGLKARAKTLKELAENAKFYALQAAAGPGRQGARPADGGCAQRCWQGIARRAGGSADLDRRRSGGRRRAPSRRRRASSSARSPSRCARRSPARPPRRRFSRSCRCLAAMRRSAASTTPLAARVELPGSMLQGKIGHRGLTFSMLR